MIDYGVGSGTETILIRLLSEFINKVNRLVVIAPSFRIQHLRSKLPNSPRLVLISSEWGEGGWQWILARVAGRVNWICRKLDGRRSRGGFRSWLEWVRHTLFLRRVLWVCKTKGVTHALCHWFLHEKSLRLKVPMGVMIQDLNWHEFPENFKPLNLDRSELDAEMLDWCDSASVVLPISNYTAEKLEHTFPQIRPKLVTVPLGAKLESEKGLTLTNFDKSDSRRIVCYYPASVYAHKSHLLLLRAVSMLYAEGSDFDLIFTGWLTDKIASPVSVEPDYLENCRQFYAENCGLWSGRVKCLGIVQEAEVEEWYRKASVVVLPSTYEGFGLPLLESLERHVRVVCSNIPPFIEQVSRYGATSSVRIFERNDLSALVDCLRGAIADVGDSSWQKNDEYELKRWSWSDAADAYVRALIDATKTPDERRT
jgi:glycosyltransferase involved in cell wall biosynthesis